MTKPSARQRLLHAANAIVMREGAGTLTLDGVAREAALSKGGVLYHFPTKNALLRAMVEGWLQEFDAAVEVAFAEEEERPGRWLRAFVRVSATHHGPSRELAAPLLAAVAHDIGLLDLVRERTARWHLRAAEGMDPARATLLRLAADGLFWSELLELAPPTGKLRARVVSQMLELMEEIADD
jgi:AcrR family transcriptional regulator